MPIPLISAIHRAAQGIAGFLDTQYNFEVAPADAHVLAHLVVHGNSTVGQIHLAYGHKRSTLTSILNRLEERSLITCKVNESDRRSLMIGLTPAGESLGRGIYKRLQELELEITTTFSSRDSRSALLVLTAFTKVTGEARTAT